MDIGKDLQNAYDNGYNDGYADAKQEVAREIFAELVGHTFEDDGWTWTISQKDIQWLADKYGVEVE